jgi:hypothetical protein
MEVRRMVKLDGFESVSLKTIFKIVASLEGLEKEGKTHFALTAPSPIAALVFDAGFDDTARKFKKAGKEIVVSNYMDFKCDPDKPRRKDEWEKGWTRYKTSYVNALKHPEIRTIITDTFTDAWELCRYANFGDATAKSFSKEYRNYAYGVANNDFRDIINWSLNPQFKKNVIFIHKLKPLWISGERTREYERNGFGDAGFPVMANLRINFIDDGEEEEGSKYFKLSIRNCRHDYKLNGVDLEGEMCEFRYLGMSLYPDSSESDWV